MPILTATRPHPRVTRPLDDGPEAPPASAVRAHVRDLERLHLARAGHPARPPTPVARTARAE
jgi:hypothetical protein